MYDTKKAEFNDAIGHINRINLSLFSAQSATESLDAYKWHRSLDMFFKELSTYMSKAEIDYFRRFSQLILESLNAEKIDAGRISNLLYNMLMDYELELRRIYDRSDLIGKKQEKGLEIFKQD